MTELTAKPQNSFLNKIFLSYRISNLVLKYFQRDLVSNLRVSKAPNLKKIGSDYGGWIVLTDLINDESICYCAGVGEDITFDLGLIEQFNCSVYAFDPTPRAINHVQNHAKGVFKFHFSDVGLWDKEEVLRFYAPSNPQHVSHSALNLQKTNSFFEAKCKRLSTLMKENSHQRIDLLKLDIEGSEYKVIDSIIEEQLDIGIICVEYDEAYNPLDAQYLRRIKQSVSKLFNYGYTLVAVEPSCNYTLVKNELYHQIIAH